VFQVDRDGDYRFTLNSDDGSKLYVDGKLVVDNDGTHPPKAVSAGVKLTKGVHKVTVDFFQAGGGAELDVFIEGTVWPGRTSAKSPPSPKRPWRSKRSSRRRTMRTTWKSSPNSLRRARLSTLPPLRQLSCAARR